MMKTEILLATLFSLTLLLLSACSSSEMPVVAEETEYSWHQAYTGGGGYITGIIQDPKDPQTIYARCDVAGVFKSTNGGESWQVMNGGMTKWYHHYVRSVTVNPQNNNIIFRCSGDKRNNILFGSIHKSVDGGQTWYEVSDQVGYFGNGLTRMYGELIAADPFDAKNMLTAGHTNGIWVSTDEGENWEYKAAKEELFVSVAINPYHQDRYYASARSGKLYHSTDRGKSWQLIFEKDSTGFSELAFDRQEADVVYGAGIYGGIYKSSDGGRSFQKKMEGLPPGYPYNTITADPNNTAILYTAPDARPNHPLAPIPIYKSADAGESWSLINNHGWDNLSQYPSYVKTLPFAGWAISKVRVDLQNSNKLLYANWYGVATSTNGGQDWNAHYFNGLETNCLENIKISGDKVYYTVADHSPMVSHDGGATYKSLPPSAFSGSSALVRSKFDTSVVLFSSWHRPYGAGGIFKVEGDKSILMQEWAAPAFVQALREDPFHAGVFYAYVDGAVDDKGGLYISKDWGKVWEKLPLQLPDYIRHLPHHKKFIEEELLNIVVTQRKNVCGADKLLCLDPHQRGTIYFGEWTEGIFKSTDGGKNWTNLKSKLPFRKDTASVLAVLQADTKRPGHLYAGFIREGLWRSKDYGENWEKVYPIDNTIFNVNSLHIGGVSGDELYIAGENLYWSQSPVSLRKSSDGGQTWQDIYNPAVGAIRIKGIDVDRQTGRIVVASSGNGAFYVEPGQPAQQAALK